MTRSMTAFARIEGEHIAWEIRSVNQRYLDTTFRLPENLRIVEPELRNLLRGKLHRGKVECSLRFDSSPAGIDGDAIDFDALSRLGRLVDHISAAQQNIAPVNPLEMLKWPGVMKEEAEEFDVMASRVKKLFAKALDALVDMREREGRELEKVLVDRLQALSSLVGTIREQAPVIADRLATRLREKIADLGVDTDAGRLEQELVYMAQRADVQEELDRLETHIEEVRNTLASDGPVGRRLDFLMQELNREANTLSSKSSTADTSIQAVELKVTIEQMREQIQNIE
ncbi:MAG: YicC family protein [Pseudomonadales bacterium]|nr:YicC family protein [Pseudomonadales bacterium]